MKRGDIIFVDFDPTKRHEQTGARPALVLSPAAFNRISGLALVVPVTSRVRGFAFETPLSGTRTTGVALCQQARTINTRARRCKVVEQVPNAVVEDALARLRAILAQAADAARRYLDSGGTTPSRAFTRELKDRMRKARSISPQLPKRHDRILFCGLCRSRTSPIIPLQCGVPNLQRGAMLAMTEWERVGHFQLQPL